MKYKTKFSQIRPHRFVDRIIGLQSMKGSTLVGGSIVLIEAQLNIVNRKRIMRNFLSLACL